MIGFFEVLDDLVKRGLIDPEKDRWDKPEEWELTKRLRAAEEEISQRKSKKEENCLNAETQD